MPLADDHLSAREWDILEAVKRGAHARELIAKELNLDKTSGRLQLDLLSLSGRGWLRPSGTHAISWELTDDGREELQRRSSN